MALSYISGTYKEQIPTSNHWIQALTSPYGMIFQIRATPTAP